jgi:hypothetical protein
MSGAIPPLRQYVFMAWCLVKHRDNFTFMTLKTHTNYRHLASNERTSVKYANWTYVQ